MNHGKQDNLLESFRKNSFVENSSQNLPTDTTAGNFADIAKKCAKKYCHMKDLPPILAKQVCQW